jgi:hypothetical protein
LRQGYVETLHAGIRVFLQGRAEPGRGLVASPRPAGDAGREHQASTLPVAVSDPRLPFTRENEQAGYSWQQSAQQVEFSITMTLGAGRAGILQRFDRWAGWFSRWSRSRSVCQRLDAGSRQGRGHVVRAVSGIPSGEFAAVSNGKGKAASLTSAH